MNEVSEDIVRQVWNVQNLGDITEIVRPERGSINPCFIVNDGMVIRFATSTDKGTARFESEAVAYTRLKSSGVPVPQVVKVDVWRESAPFPYLITTKLAGKPVIDTWQDLGQNQQQYIAFSAGKYLAMIHNQTYAKFGKLHELPSGGFAQWNDYVWDFFRRYARQALVLKAIDTKLEARIHAAFLFHKPMMDLIANGSLVHSDFHFENILQENGDITGIIDFEWAYAGDPSQDFVVEEQWEKDCMGSREHVMKGYASLRELDDKHNLRLTVYKLLWRLETVVDHKKAKRETEFQDALKLLTVATEALEAQM